jgi:DNA primase
LVEAVAPTDRIEEVFCCVEPRTHTFVVGPGYLSGNCFSRCGISGNYEHAVETILGCDNKAARKFILQFTVASLGVKVERPVGGSGNRKTITGDSSLAEDARRLERGDFTYLPKEARDYLDGRGISASARGSWQIGFDEEAVRIVIPAFDRRGVLRFLIRRLLRDGRPKYLYTDGAIKTSILFGIDHVPEGAEEVVLVEGSLDTIHMHELGVLALGTLGSGLSDQQVRLLMSLPKLKRVYTMFDRDAAGVSNTIDACNKLQRVPLFVCTYPRGVEDPAEHHRTTAARAMELALPRHQFLRRVSKMRTTSTGRKVGVGTY